MQNLRLGIDTGGTYTDAVLLNDADQVEASAKVLTNHQDLVSSIRNVLDTLPQWRLRDTRLVSLSTTLGTNAVVEGRGTPACLLLAGYNETQVRRARLHDLVAGGHCVLLAGAHDAAGNETEPLDLATAEKMIRHHRDQVTAFGISGMFSVRNPAHEIALRELVLLETDLPVTCGHELANALDAPRRAVTVAFNATLVSYIDRLIRSVQQTLNEHAINAPLMVVKGDGSLITAKLALERPVETILSGPAASVVGALHYTPCNNAIIADMGGTTTDIAIIAKGRAVLSQDATQVGPWRPMVESVRVLSIGLGGDSEVGFSGGAGLAIGPRRVVPMSLLIDRHPQLMSALISQSKTTPSARSNRFAVPLFATQAQYDNLAAAEKQAWETLSEGPIDLSLQAMSNRPLTRSIAELVRGGLALYSGYTPSDAAHVLGLMNHWSTEAAQLATTIWQRQMRQVYGWGRRSSDDPCEIARVVHQKVITSIVQAIMRATLECDHPNSSKSELAALNQLVIEWIHPHKDQSPGSLLSLAYDQTVSLISVGAPASSYYPQVAIVLGLELKIPEHAAVTNAIGAIVGSVIQRERVAITQPTQGLFRVHDANGPRDYTDLEAATEYAEKIVRRIAGMRARAAGAEQIEVRVSRNDNTVESDDEPHPVFFESHITATASGRPGQTQELLPDINMSSR